MTGATDFPDEPPPFPGTGDGSGTDDQSQAKDPSDEVLWGLGNVLAKKRDEWIRERAAQGVDKRWEQDTDQYHQRDEANRQTSSMMEAAEQGFPVVKEHARATRSTIFIGLTRQKTNAGEARLADILLPTDDRNWGIQPAPDSSLARMAKEQGPATDHQDQPIVDAAGNTLAKSKAALLIMEAVSDACKAMQELIDRQLNQTDYNGVQRKVLHYAAMLGTGVLKGPVVTNKYRRSWAKSTDATGKPFYQIAMQEEALPASYEVDPRNVWTDPGCGDDHQKGEGIFEREVCTGRQIRDLALQPGFMKDQLRKVLMEGPKTTATLVQPVPGPDKEIDTSQLHKTFEKWEYWGDITAEQALAGGIPPELLGDIDFDDPLSRVRACVIFVNNTVVKVHLNPIDTGDLPYDFYVWEKVTGSVWGYGVPYLMRAQQKVINSCWRQLMDNLGITAGPQIVLKRGSVEPADGEWTLTSRKVWWANSDVPDVRMAFNSIEFNSHADELIKVIEFSMKLVDEETAVPMLAQGEKGTAPETVGGMQLLMNSSNVVLRRLVKQWDDMITRPHITRYYDYNMLYSEHDDVKGDFAVDARGTSALLVRDIQNQAFMNLLQQGSNPTYAVFLDLQKLFEAALKAQHIDPTEIMATPTVIAQRMQAQQQAAQQHQDPRVMAAQIKTQGEQARTASQEKIAQLEAQTMLQKADTDRAARLEELQAQKEVAMLQMANKQNISLQQIQSSLAKIVIQTNTQKELAAAEHHLKAQALLQPQDQSAAPSEPGPYDGGSNGNSGS